MKMNDKVYDILKWLAILALPALGKCIEGIFGVWGIPYGPEIAETIEYVSICLGTILGVSAIQYNIEQKKAENQK